jgi:hypothetical protein
MEVWDTAYVDMFGPAYIQIGDAGVEMAFGGVQIGRRCEYGETSIWFSLTDQTRWTKSPEPAMPNSKKMAHLTAKLA